MTEITQADILEYAGYAIYDNRSTMQRERVNDEGEVVESMTVGEVMRLQRAGPQTVGFRPKPWGYYPDREE